MFFIFGMSLKEKRLDFNQTIVCPCCGSYGGLKAFMTYNYFSLFFIPLFKWDKKYYLKSTCCGSVYTISKNIDESMEMGRINKIDESDLKVVHSNYRGIKKCNNCNYPIESGFEYCPKCGTKL